MYSLLLFVLIEFLSLVNQVEFELSVAGRIERSHQAMLYVAKNNSMCHWKHACPGQDLLLSTTDDDDVMICLVSFVQICVFKNFLQLLLVATSYYLPQRVIFY